VGLTTSCTYKLTKSAQEEDIDSLCQLLCTDTILTASTDEMVSGVYHASEAKVSTGFSSPASSEIALQPGFYPYASITVDKKARVSKRFFEAVHGGMGTEFTRQVVWFTREMEEIVSKSDPKFTSPLDKKGKIKDWGKNCEERATVAKSERLGAMFQYLTHWYVSS